MSRREYVLDLAAFALGALMTEAKQASIALTPLACVKEFTIRL